MLLPSQHIELTETYKQLYLGEVDDITDVMIEEVVEEIIEECVEFGYDLDEAAELVEEAATEYLMELNPYAAAGSKEARAYQKSTTATKRGEARRAAVQGAVERVKTKAKGVAAAAGIAGSIAKDEARRAGRGAAHAAGKAASAAGSAVKGAAGAVSAAASKKKAEVKQGVKGLIGRGLRKAAGAIGNVAQRAAGAASRLGEEVERIDEIDSSIIARTDLKRRQNLSAAQEKENSARDAGASMGERSKLAANTSDAAAKVSGHRALSTAHARSRTRMRDSGQTVNDSYEYDLYDIILEHLVDEGYADTNENALVIMTNMSEEWREEIIDEARRADREGHERGTAANPNRNDVPHSDPSQQTMLHSRLRRRADEMGRARRGSSAYKSGSRPALSKKEKALLQASDRTSPGRGHVRNPNVPDTGSHKRFPSERRAQKDPKQNPKHNTNKD